MKKIKVGEEGVALVDDEDYASLSKYRWRLKPARKGTKNIGYAIRFEKGNRYMHREIMNPPEDMLIDHINGNGLDNRKRNLRIVTKSENQWNGHKHRAGRLPGVNNNRVSPEGKRYYYASRTIRGKKTYLGSASSMKAAHELWLKSFDTYKDLPRPKINPLP